MGPGSNDESGLFAFGYPVAEGLRTSLVWGTPRSMRLAEILNVDRTTTSLPPHDKDAVLGALAELFPTLSRETVLEGFREREALATTGVGSGVAVPHARLASVDRTIGALAISREGVEFESIDGQPVHVIVAIVAPERGDLVKVLARIARLLRDADLRERLVAAADGEQAYTILIRADGL